MTRRVRGAGRGGGLLFVALLVFLAYLAGTALTGFARAVALVGLGSAVLVALRAVLRRR